MGRIVVHAGMAKTGSTSIQSWLRDHGGRLRDEAGFTVLKAFVIDGKLATGIHEDGTVNSSDLPHHLDAHSAHRRGIAEQFAGQLGELARRHGRVVISAEGLSRHLRRLDDVLAVPLDALAREHEVRVAYYVRPQHSALEAAWRARGFTGDQSPSGFLERQSHSYHHDRTMSLVARLAPQVCFEPRPFRRDLLRGGNAVTDFAQTFLGMEASHDMDVWSNLGFPLDIVNALRPARLSLLQASEGRRRGDGWIKRFVSSLDLPESERARLSRLVLQQACHDRFEEENRRMIAALGWPTDAWVPPVSEDIGEASFERLDELWAPDASQAELATLHHVLSLLRVELEQTRQKERRRRKRERRRR